MKHLPSNRNKQWICILIKHLAVGSAGIKGNRVQVDMRGKEVVI